MATRMITGKSFIVELEAYNEDPLHHQVKSKKDCSCSTNTASFTDDIKGIREDLTADYGVEVETALPKCFGA